MSGVDCQTSVFSLSLAVVVSTTSHRNPKSMYKNFIAYNEDSANYRRAKKKAYYSMFLK